MQEEKQHQTTANSFDSNDNQKDDKEPTPNPKVSYRWQISRVYKGNIASQENRYLSLTIEIPQGTQGKEGFRAFTSAKQVPFDMLDDEEQFNAICTIGYSQMREQIKKTNPEVWENLWI